VTLYESGDAAGSMSLFYRLLPLCRAMFYETNPIPVKAAMEMLGYCTSEMRLPLLTLSEENRARLKSALIDYGILKK